MHASPWKLQFSFKEHLAASVTSSPRQPVCMPYLLSHWIPQYHANLRRQYGWPVGKWAIMHSALISWNLNWLEIGEPSAIVHLSARVASSPLFCWDVHSRSGQQWHNGKMCMWAGPEKSRPVEPIPEKKHTEDVLLGALLDLSEYDIPTNAVLREVLRKKGFQATVVSENLCSNHSADPIT